MFDGCDRWSSGTPTDYGEKVYVWGDARGRRCGLCLGVGVGWGVGIGVEAAFPGVMAWGENIALWGGFEAGAGAVLARAEAAASNSATIYDTFTGSTLGMVDKLLALAQMQSLRVTDSLWKALSANWVSGAGSATALLGEGLNNPELRAASTLITELKILNDLGTKVTYILY